MGAFIITSLPPNKKSSFCFSFEQKYWRLSKNKDVERVEKLCFGDGKACVEENCVVNMTFPGGHFLLQIEGKSK